MTERSRINNFIQNCVFPMTLHPRISRTQITDTLQTSHMTRKGGRLMFTINFNALRNKWNRTSSNDNVFCSNYFVRRTNLHLLRALKNSVA